MNGCAVTHTLNDAWSTRRAAAGLLVSYRPLAPCRLIVFLQAFELSFQSQRWERNALNCPCFGQALAATRNP